MIVSVLAPLWQFECFNCCVKNVIVDGNFSLDQKFDDLVGGTSDEEVGEPLKVERID